MIINTLIKSISKKQLKLLSLFLLSVIIIVVNGQLNGQNYLVSNASSNAAANGIYEPNGVADGVTAYRHLTNNFSMYRETGIGWIICVEFPPFINCLTFIDAETSGAGLLSPTPPLGAWSGGTIISIPPLPVELSFFKAKQLNKSVLLEWETFTETNNHGFYLQKSKDGRSWEEMQFISGNGTVTDNNYYSYKDEKVDFGKYYYRLQQVDYDGQIVYSNIASIYITKGNEVALYPNPTTGLLKIIGLRFTDTAEFKLFNQTGALLLQASFSNHQVDISGFPNGLYFFTIKNEQQAYWGKVMKE